MRLFDVGGEREMLSNEEAKRLCLGLIKADTVDEVISLLKEAGFWDGPKYWRYYGDRENNFSTIGNQQSRPEAALVEKLVNSVDARLMSECLVGGFDPEGEGVPTTIQDAVARYFENDSKAGSIRAGKIKNWPNQKRTEVARGITLAATGARPQEGNPCFTISDVGEGQTPERMPETLLSIDKKNKLRIPFVQGKFNMGGTGALQFCGKYNLQLIVSRRNHNILSAHGESHDDDQLWGFTVVRREDPDAGRRSSVYRYLAPIGCDSKPGEGGVLRFSADELPFFPERNDPYKRTSEWGTLIKLYEFSATGHRGHILRKDGMLSRLDILLADVALPIRLHECRLGYRGHTGSFETTMTGVGVRLEDDRAENIEGYYSFALSVSGQHMTGTIYTFKKGKADAYRKNEGIIFTVNGQTHGHLTADFFRRLKVGMSYLADSILVVVNCNQMSGRAREDLFMNSRDRLRHGDLRTEIEKALEDILKNHEGLRELRERRRQEEIKSKLEESKPLVDILESIISSSPTLASLFLGGTRISNPHKPRVVGTGKKFEGKAHPTFFRFKGEKYGAVLNRKCHINMRCRIAFETDVVNDYFDRDENPGRFELEYETNGASKGTVMSRSLNLKDGIANLSVELPAGVNEGDEIKFESTVTDDTLVEPLKNVFVVRVKEPGQPKTGGGKRRKPPKDEEGEDRDLPSGLNMPNIEEVKEPDWEKHAPPFDKYTALKIMHAGEVPENGEDDNNTSTVKQIYDFFINLDNIYLRTELKAKYIEPEILRARYIYGLILLGLAMIHGEVTLEQEQGEDDEDSNVNIEDLVYDVSKSISPILLPMIESLGGLDLEEIPSLVESGESD
ncbi:MAG: hypothetical protein RX318_07640 [bacterium]|nr:hypothetical protein [bacterium]